MSGWTLVVEQREGWAYRLVRDGLLDGVECLLAVKRETCLILDCEGDQRGIVIVELVL